MVMSDHGRDEPGNDLKKDGGTTIEGEDTIPTATLDNFIEARRNGAYLVDKTGLIADVLSDTGSKVFLFCRPRRFGKSINLTMLDAYLNLEYAGNDWFEGMEISRTDRFDGLRNRFPVVYMNLKTLEAEDESRLARRFGTAIREAYRGHRYLLKSDALAEDERRAFEFILTRDVGIYDPEDLRFLTELLHRHHGVGAVVLIDEYDAPVHSALGKDHYRVAVDSLRRILSPLLKDNPHVFKAVLVGILQIARESLFSGLNNLKVSTVIDDKGFADCFGLTETEVEGICAEAGHPEVMEVLKANYDGYTIGGLHIYNPYSVMNYFDNRMKPMRYWVSTSSEDLFRVILASGNPDISDSIGVLLAGDSIEEHLDQSLHFPPSGRAEDMNPKEVFTLMLQSGYLTATTSEDGGLKLRVPNGEIMGLLRDRVRDWMGSGLSCISGLPRYLLSGDVEGVTACLRKVVGMKVNDRMMSGVKNTHTMHQLVMWGMLLLADGYTSDSEFHSGDGVSDTVLIPDDGDMLGALLEIKEARDGSLEKAAIEAENQIREKRYRSGIRGSTVHAYAVALGPDDVMVRRVP